MSKLLLAPAGASAEGLSQFERERLERIENNKKRMAAVMAGVDVSLLVCSPRMTPVRPKKRKAGTPLTVSSERRRSSRISNLPTPLYCIEQDLTERSQGHRSRSSTQGGPNGRRCHNQGHRSPGITAAAGGVADPYICGKMGWKKECGSAGLAAAESATDAALSLQRKLTGAGRPAAVKLMSTSQVSGGFWSQLPCDIIKHFGACKRTICLHCDDKVQQDPQAFLYAAPGSSSCWPVVYLPKGDGGGSGLSGGWRGFAIDMRLFPNDTVVYEVLDAPPKDSAAAGAAPDSGSTHSSAGSDQGSSQAPVSTPAVQPNQRQHLRVHIFRASAYETSQAQAKEPTTNTQQQQQGSAELLETPEGAVAKPLLLPGPGSQVAEQQQHSGGTQMCRLDSEDSAAVAAATVAAYDGADDLLADVPLAKRAKAAAAAAPGGDQGARLMAAAEAGLLPGVKVARQLSSSGGTSSMNASKSSHVACGTPGGDDVNTSQQPGLRGSSRHSDTATAAAKDNKTIPKKRLQSRAAATVASKAWAFAAGWLSGSSSRDRAAASAALVPKPANPGELVPPPTADERRRARSKKAAFPVEQILAHRVNVASGGDELLIRWRDFGQYWDSWEPSSSLTHPPGSYDWQGGSAAVPDKFRL